MQVYWSSVFILPKAITQQIDKLMRSFLWNQGDNCQGKAKVSWKTVCLAKDQGGLGLRSLSLWNTALMAVHIWHLLIRKDSLWVKWIHTYRLKGRNFWDVQLKQDASWGWRKLLQIREQFKHLFIWVVGNGQSISLWYENWGHEVRLNTVITKRQMLQAGLSDNLTVHDMVNNHGWIWPENWRIQPQKPVLTDKHDECKLSDADGKSIEFSVKNLWSIIKPGGPIVSWYKIVWFPQCIPRHSFMMWLAIIEKFRTQDKMQAWNSNIQPCYLCNVADEDQKHLFFECPYSSTVWSTIRTKAMMDGVPPIWDDIIAFLEPSTCAHAAWSVVDRLMIAAAVYFIWQERNHRWVGKSKRTAEQLAGNITEVIKLKLLTLVFRPSRNVQRIAEVWHVPLKIRHN